MLVSENRFLKMALEDPSAQWELYDGHPRRKPGMTFEHNDAMGELAFQLRSQLDRRFFRVRENTGHARSSSLRYYIPDVSVIPIELGNTQRGTHRLEVYAEPLALVVEIWAPSTGLYDIEAKLPEYKLRGDQEIWRIHPYEHSLTAWVRQADGSYVETNYAGGLVRPTALPGVEIDLDALWG